MNRARLLLVVLATLSGAGASNAPAQDARNEQFYYPGSFNWAFLKNYPNVARLFNAFDYGHAILYETLYTKTDSVLATTALDREYRFLTSNLLVKPPRFSIAEEAIEPNYARLAWRAMRVFDWAHVLHRQIYDVYSDERLTAAGKDSLIERLTDYYLSNAEVALPSAPKSMSLMEGQYFSNVFRQRHPTFNGLIWAYHWLQVGLYEPLIAGQTAAERKEGVAAAVERFWQMLRDPPGNMPRVMPMTVTVASRFTERHPRAAAIFDNLHMMHDIISDILVSNRVPREQKRDAIYRALSQLQDPDSNVMSRVEWAEMGQQMGGVEAMGGKPK